MIINAKNIAIANSLRDKIRKKTDVVSDGEGAAMVLLWGFLLEHAQCNGVDVEQLAREQLDAFVRYAREHLKMVYPH